MSTLFTALWKISLLEADLAQAQRHADRWRNFAKKQSEALEKARKVIRHAWIDGAHEDAREWLEAYPAPSEINAKP
jgi:hypothetical protein